MLKIILNVDHIYIIGEAKDWKISDPKIDFLKIENIFPDNHQRFIIFRSPSYNVAMTARKTKCKKNGKDRIEGALTNKKDAVSFLAQILGTKIYSQKQ